MIDPSEMDEEGGGSLTLTFEVELLWHLGPDDDDPSPEEFDIEEAVRRYLASKAGLVAPDEITARRR